MCDPWGYDGFLPSSEIKANDERLEYTFTWFIENYSYCLQKNTEVLTSPEFFVRGLQGTTWYLHLFPRGCLIKHKGYISILLQRYKFSEGPEEISLNFELSLLGPDESAFISKKIQCTFRNGDSKGWVGFIHMSELFSRQKATLLSGDILRVRCKMWIDEEIRTVGQSFARTRIRVDHLYFIHVVEELSKLKPNAKRTFQFRCSKQEGYLKSRLQLVDSSNDGKLIIKITASSTEKNLLKCSLFLLGVSGVHAPCGDKDYRSDIEGRKITSLPLSLTKNSILEREEYLPGDTLTLLCHCSFSTGVKYSKIERTLYEIPSLVLNQINGDPITKKLAACSSVVDDLKMLYTSQLLSDVKIKTKTKSYPAHKNLLCTRSSVFKDMLTNDTEENSPDCIEMDDLENETVEKFLHFLYSDKVENLEWDSAIKLYKVADKYDVRKLKSMCSSFLLENINNRNVVELQFLLDAHNDVELQRAVREFIQNPTDKVFSSDS